MSNRPPLLFFLQHIEALTLSRIGGVSVLAGAVFFKREKKLNFKMYGIEEK